MKVKSRSKAKQTQKTLVAAARAYFFVRAQAKQALCAQAQSAYAAQQACWMLQRQHRWGECPAQVDKQKPESARRHNNTQHGTNTTRVARVGKEIKHQKTLQQHQMQVK